MPEGLYAEIPDPAPPLEEGRERGKEFLKGDGKLLAGGKVLWQKRKGFTLEDA